MVTKPLALAALATTLAGCGVVGAFDVLRPSEPGIPWSAHFPAKVQVGQPFRLALDLDPGCKSLDRFVVAADAATRVIKVDLLLRPQPSDQACPAMIHLARYETTIAPAAVGTWTLSFDGVGGRKTQAIEVVAEPQPAWQAPALDPSGRTSNL